MDTRSALTLTDLLLAAALFVFIGAIDAVHRSNEAEAQRQIAENRHGLNRAAIIACQQGIQGLTIEHQGGIRQTLDCPPRRTAASQPAPVRKTS